MNNIETKTKEQNTQCGGNCGKCGETLCWSCVYATGKQFEKPLRFVSRKTGEKRVFYGCPWATKFVAVPGWKAEKTTIKNRLGNEVSYQNSYLVSECPYYEFNGDVDVTIEEIIAELGLPVRYTLSNRSILWDYYDIYKMFMKELELHKPANIASHRDAKLTVKKAALRAFMDDLNYELEEGEITEEEYDIKLDAVDTLEAMLVKYHYKTMKKESEASER